MWKSWELLKPGQCLRGTSDPTVVTEGEVSVVVSLCLRAGFTQVLDKLASSDKFKGRFRGYSLLVLRQSSALGGARLGAESSGANIAMDYTANTNIFYRHTFSSGSQ